MAGCLPFFLFFSTKGSTLTTFIPVPQKKTFEGAARDFEVLENKMEGKGR